MRAQDLQELDSKFRISLQGSLEISIFTEY